MRSILFQHKNVKMLCKLAAALLLIGIFPVLAFAESGKVAKVGVTEYETIDEAIANWKKDTTLTLLADVTLSDTVTLKSTEHHILDLGKYTMTAADGKNAFEIEACGTGDAERFALTIKADGTNPGGINAGTKSVVYYDYAKGPATGNDRPIITIEGGVFTGSTSTFSWGSTTAGIYAKGSAARKCATLHIKGGTFNCSIIGTGKSKLLISGGTFNNYVSSQGDSTCYRQISGGTFKGGLWMTADASNKFWFGTSLANYNVGVYVDDEGSLVVGGPVITEPGTKFKASSANYSGATPYLQYSSAKGNGLYYTSIEEALADNNKASGEVTVYVDILDLTGSTYKGTILLPDGKSDLTITYKEGTTPAWKIGTDASGKTVVCTESISGGVVTRVYTVKDAYVVEHYQQDVDGSGYTRIETETLGGNANDATAASPKSYPGFTAQDFSQGTIVAGGTTVVQIYYNRNLFKVTYVDNVPGETVFADVEKTALYEGKAPSFGSDPVRVGYTFTGWYKDSACNNAWDPETDTVNGEIKLYAGWTQKTYTVTYYADGTKVDSITVAHGKDAAAPAIPEKKGFTAVWDHDGKNITADTEIHAIYTALPEIPETGDDSNLGLWIALLMISGLGILVPGLIKRKYSL